MRIEGDEFMKEEGFKSRLLIIIGCIIFLLVISGVICAVIFYPKSQKENNKVSTAVITMNYTGKMNGISLTSGNFYDDNTGKLLTNEENIFDFSVNAKLVKNTKVNYEIIAFKDENSTVFDNNVRLYLEKATDNSYSSVKKIMEPTCYRAVKSTPISKKEGMVLDTGIFDKSTTNYYRLKMWVNGENVDINNPKYFKVKVNIYGNAE